MGEMSQLFCLPVLVRLNPIKPNVGRKDFRTSISQRDLIENERQLTSVYCLAGSYFEETMETQDVAGQEAQDKVEIWGRFAHPCRTLHS